MSSFVMKTQMCSCSENFAKTIGSFVNFFACVHVAGSSLTWQGPAGSYSGDKSTRGLVLSVSVQCDGVSFLVKFIA